MRLCHLLLLSLFLYSCAPSRSIAKAARQTVIAAAPLRTAHVGISIYDPEKKTFIYEHQGDRYFVPASNTKIPTLYAVMKYLGDSITGIRYAYGNRNGEKLLLIQPAADPTFLHPDYPHHPLVPFLKAAAEHGHTLIVFDTVWKDAHWGSGWAWTDYEAAYMAEKSSLPVGGNVVQVRQERTGDSIALSTPLLYFDSLLKAQRPSAQLSLRGRALHGNSFSFGAVQQPGRVNIPFVTGGSETAAAVLAAQLPAKVERITSAKALGGIILGPWQTMAALPLDSVLVPLMHRSDNFFAEQLLLAVSQRQLGYMHTLGVIDTLLQADLGALPQRPRWADGSGLSRYNLFTPQDMVALLDSLRLHFGMERLKAIFPTGNEGTLTNYYRDLQGALFAKTGTLSGVVALSGYLFTKKNRLLLFSVIVNNHQASAAEVRRAVEAFLLQLHAAQ